MGRPNPQARRGRRRLEASSYAGRVLSLAMQGQTVPAIAAALHIGRSRVRKDLDHWEKTSVISKITQRKRGAAARYDKGPAWASSISGQVAHIEVREIPGTPMTKPPAAARVHASRWAVPIFADELGYRNVETGAWIDRRPAGLTEGAERSWELRGLRFWLFEEESRGKWELILYARPKPVGRRQRIGTVLLMPVPMWLQAPALARTETAEFTAAVQLLAWIRESRRLRLGGIPIQVRLTEYGFPLEDDPSIPAGKRFIGPSFKAWTDRSRPGRLPELETTDAGVARKLALTLPILERAPGLYDEIVAWADRIVKLEREVAELREAMRDRRL